MFVSRGQQFVRAVHETAYTAMDDKADQVVTAIKEEIGTPYPPASTPGNPPHRRTGNLQEGVEQITTESRDGVETQIGSSRQEGDPRVPMWLEFGTDKGQMAPRPYMSPAQRKYGPEFKTASAEALRGMTA